MTDSGKRPARGYVVAIVVVLCGLVLTACSDGNPATSATVTGSHLPSHLNVQAASGSASPTELRTLSAIVKVSPSGPLASPATLHIALERHVPPSLAVFVRTSESLHGPWTFVPATLSADRMTVVVMTDHFSFFQALGLDVGTAIDEFKRNFLDAFDSAATMDVSRPQCQGEMEARSGGYSITSSVTNTVFWCFGLDGQTRILKVTDDRRYPLEILHPNVTVSQPGSMDWGQLSSLSHFGSGAYTILAPGDTATFALNIPPKSQGGISTTLDGLGQALDALQVGITSLITILTRFGLGGGVKSIDAMGKVLDSGSCADALTHGPGAILANCLSASELKTVFGWKGLLLAPVVLAGGLASFFHSEFNALVDTINEHDNYKVVITNSNEANASIVTTSGAVGTLQIGTSTEAEVQDVAGPPQSTSIGNMVSGSTDNQSMVPNYRALGYNCNPPSGDPIESCQTVYFLDASTGVLQSFATTSRSFRTTNGTTVGASVAMAEQLEGQQFSSPGCEPASIYLGGSATTTWVAIRSTDGQKVTSIESENSAPADRSAPEPSGPYPGNSGIGLLFC
jgi:hypothetical protein